MDKRLERRTPAELRRKLQLTALGGREESDSWLQAGGFSGQLQTTSWASRRQLLGVQSCWNYGRTWEGASSSQGVNWTANLN